MENAILSTILNTACIVRCSVTGPPCVAEGRTTAASASENEKIGNNYFNRVWIVHHFFFSKLEFNIEKGSSQ